MPYYASAEQIMRDRSELARKGIARGRSVIALTYADGVLFVAENPSSSLHKVSELYDRLGFAAVGKYNEFENLRRAGIKHADMVGYSYDRRDVTGRSLANAYAQTLGTIFTEQPKPYEVELCVAEVGRARQARHAQLYRITYDGSIVDEHRFVVMGGATDPIVTALKASYTEDMTFAAAVSVAVAALEVGTTQPANGDVERRRIGVESLEVAVLDQNRPRRAFKRIAGSALSTLLPTASVDSEPEAGAGTADVNSDGPVAG